MEKIRIGDRFVGEGEPTYFIAEIGSNFDGDIKRAKMLIDLAKECGADAAKFQSFKSNKIICAEGFQDKSSFQAKWGGSVEDVYKAAELPRDWHKELSDYCKMRGIHFMSSPYDTEAVDILEGLDVPAYKIGSGDITWLDMLDYIARKGKPIILGCGASTISEIDEAIRTIRKAGNNNIILLQCITNYPSVFEDANVRAMAAMREAFGVNVGYSDHTPGSVVPLASVALGGCVVEKHFTDDITRTGPDHPFAMDASDFKKMVDETRLIEKALGSKVKELAPSESETVILQRRCVRAVRDIPVGTVLDKYMLDILRPCPEGAIAPKFANYLIGKTLKKDLKKGDALFWDAI
jgi:sialic acid synthase SpsE